MPLALLLAIASPAPQAADSEWLVQVRPGVRRNFYDDSRPGCPALIAKCRRAGYVVPGDQLIAHSQRGALTYVTYVNRGGKSSWGLIESAGLIRVTPPLPTNASWIGDWSATEANIEIKPAGRRGWFAVSGYATWGASDPDRVARGAINLGDMAGEIALTDGRITAVTGNLVRRLPPESPDTFECYVTLRLLGPYLIAEDNSQCGGMNVTFSGVYRR